MKTKSDIQSDITHLRERHERATLEREIASLESEANELRMMEAVWGDRVMGGNWADDPDSRSTGGPYRIPPRPFTSIDDRTNERYYPYYANETDLRYMRAESRTLAAFTSISIGAMESLGNYVLGDGGSIAIQPAADVEPDAQLVRDAQRIIDRVLDDNQFFNDMDREIHDRSREDGDAFAVLTYDGAPRIDMVEPDEVTEPANKPPLARMLGIHPELLRWDYGIGTRYNPQLKREDSARPIGYHMVFDDHGSSWDYIPEHRVVHIKRNVPRRAKRGVSDYEPVKADIANSEKLRNNLTIGAAIQSAIALIRQHGPGTAKSDVTARNNANAEQKMSRSRSGGTMATVNAERYTPGKIVDVRNAEYHAGPLGQLRSAVYVEVAQFVMRSIGTRWVFPEYMLTADASNANFASTLVAESPFVKARENDQSFYKFKWRELVWKILRMCHQHGSFARGRPWSEVRALLKIAVDYAEVASRDRSQQIAVDTQLNQLGIKSKRSIATGFGLDLDDELAEIANEPQPAKPGAEGALAESRFFTRNNPLRELLADPDVRALMVHGSHDQSSHSKGGGGSPMPSGK